MSRQQRALVEAQQLERTLLFERSHHENHDPALRLLGFCLHRLGQPWRRLTPLPAASFQDLLNANDIHHRAVNAPRDPTASEFPLLLVFDQTDGEPMALYRQGRCNWFYSAQQQRHWPASVDSCLRDIAYELYPSLPAKVSGPWSVLQFAFSIESAALIALLLTSGVVMLFNLAVPMLTNLVVSRILPHNDRQLLLQGLAVTILIVIASVAAQYLQNRMMLRLESVADLRLQSAVWDRLLRLPMDFIARYTTGDLSSRVNAITQLRQLLGSGVLSTLLSSLFAISYFALMVTYDSSLSLWASLFTLMALSCILLLTIQAIRLQKPLMESGAEITNFSLQSVMGLPQIRSAGAESFLLVQWLKRISDYALLQLRNNIFSDAIEQYATLVAPIASMFLFAIVTYQLLDSRSTTEATAIVVAFVSFNAAFSSFNTSITGVANLVATTAGQATVLWKRAEPVMYADVEPGHRPDAIQHQLRGQFQFRDVHYAYPGRSEGLFQGLSFDIQTGEHTAITGPSGCGKTTLVRMLLGFTEPTSGEILVDRIPIHQLAIRTYRRQLGVVMQTARLNAGSIYDVICGGLQFSEQQVWDALEHAAIAEEVRAMPMQLETLLSDSGGNISGGQVQRIAIARALITAPRVLIMDEATSALDNHSQQVITQTIENLGITRISIAHRLSTIRQADRIIVLEPGCPADQGSWAELSQRGYLARMLSSH